MKAETHLVLRKGLCHKRAGTDKRASNCDASWVSCDTGAIYKSKNKIPFGLVKGQLWAFGLIAVTSVFPFLPAVVLQYFMRMSTADLFMTAGNISFFYFTGLLGSQNA